MGGRDRGSGNQTKIYSRGDEELGIATGGSQTPGKDPVQMTLAETHRERGIDT